jgi:hypothetical protein
MDTAGRFRGSVAPNAAGERELLEETLHSRYIFSLIWINHGVRALEVRLRQDRRRPVARPGDNDGVQVVLIDQPVKVKVGEALTGIRAPVTQEPRLRVLRFQRLPKQGVLLEVQHPQTEVEASTPVRVGLAQLVGAERGALDRRASRTVRGDRVFRVVIGYLFVSIFSHTVFPPQSA